MRRIITLTVAGLLIFVFCTLHAEAGPVKDMQRRIDKLQRRIDAGIKTHRIGAKQARELNKNLNSIRREFDTIKANPILFALERGNW